MAIIPTILLADNDETFLQVTSEYLERNGYKVLCAKDPSSARHILEHNIIALALIDYRLTNDRDETDESGYLLARDAKESLSVPKIILTRFDQPVDYVVKSLRRDKNGHSPAVDYISKKDQPQCLLDAIRNTLLKANIFLCYSHADGKQVAELYDKLEAAGFSPWMDIRNLVPGENWARAIRREILCADFFVACLSKNSITKRGFLQKEMKMAWDVWDGKLESDIYLIPARLEECDIPPDERLAQLQWVDLFQRQGMRDLVTAIQAGLLRQQH